MDDETKERLDRVAERYAITNVRMDYFFGLILQELGYTKEQIDEEIQRSYVKGKEACERIREKLYIEEQFNQITGEDEKEKDE